MEFQLVLKKLNNTLTAAEEQEFNSWLSESETHAAYFEKVKQRYSQSQESVSLEKAWLPIAVSINQTKKRNLIIKRLLAAAAVVLLLLAPFYYNRQAPATTPTPTQVVSAIEMGTDKATLTLADGSKVNLEAGGSYEENTINSNGKTLVYNTKKEQSTAALQYNVLNIPRGGQFKLVLADGTKVWLNSDSELKYPIAFAQNGARKVELIHGEAYFEVSPSSQHQGNHFVVLTQGQEVDVLGTAFNIKAYKEDPHIKTTLVHGSVAISNGTQKAKLKPGHQSTWEKSEAAIAVATVDVNNVIAWKDGLFGFKQMPLKDIMTTLSRWYDIEVEIKNEKAANLMFNGVFNKKQDLQNILSIIENTNEAKFTTQGKTVLVE